MDKHTRNAPGLVMIGFSSIWRAVTVAVAAVSVSVALAGCGATQAQLDQAKAAGAQERAQQVAAQKQKDEQASLKTQVKKLQAAEAKKAAAQKKATAKASAKKTASTTHSSGSSSGARCGANLSVGSNTTCAFAVNVESDYFSAGGGYARFDSYSPITERWYAMSCVPGVPTVCRGGNNAVVYIR